jgi:hypothetical protein
LFFILKASQGKSHRNGHKNPQGNHKKQRQFSIVPSIPIVIGIGIMMQYLGIAIPWIRLTVIGALQYELLSMDTAAQALRSISPDYSYQVLIANA